MNAEKICPQCQTAAQDSDAYCASCGAVITARSTPSSAAPVLSARQPSPLPTSDKAEPAFIPLKVPPIREAPKSTGKRRLAGWLPFSKFRHG